MPKYSETPIAHFSSPRNGGRLDPPDSRGVAATPHQGPFLVLDLQIRDDNITDAHFQTYGYGPAIACGSMLTVLIIGRSIAEARSLTAEHLIQALDGLPDEKRHCADLAINALQAAFVDDLLA